MSDFALSPNTGAAVLKSANAQVVRGVAGVTIIPGQAVYFDTTTQTYKLCDANGADPSPKFAGIAANGAYAGQPVEIVTQDPDFTPGFTIAAGDIVITSSTPGALAPAADVATGQFVTVVGLGKANNKMVLNPSASGTAR